MMRRVLFAVLVVFPMVVLGQEMIKVNVLEYYDKIPAPPLDVKDAYARLVCTGEVDNQRCSSEKFYKAVVDELKPLSERMEKLNMVLSQPTVNVMQQIDPEAVKKKMESMTQEEKIQYAMQMSQQMSQQLNVANKTAPESPAVLDAIEEHGRINEQVALEMTTAADPTNPKMKLVLERSRKHDDVKTWAEAEHKKIPLVNYGPGAGQMPDQKKVAALERATLDKHLVVENDYLKALQTVWKDELAKQKARFTPYQQKLAAVHYGEDAISYTNKTTLLGGQGLMLETARSLINWSQSATDEAAGWWQQQLDLEKK